MSWGVAFGFPWAGLEGHASSSLLPPPGTTPWVIGGGGSGPLTFTNLHRTSSGGMEWIGLGVGAGHGKLLFVCNWGEPAHIVVISITFSCPIYLRLSVDPIAYNRISTWKTGILRARWIYCAAPRHLRAPSIRPAYELTASGLDTPCSVHERCPSIYAG